MLSVNAYDLVKALLSAHVLLRFRIAMSMPKNIELTMKSVDSTVIGISARIVSRLVSSLKGFLCSFVQMMYSLVSLVWQRSIKLVSLMGACNEYIKPGTREHLNTSVKCRANQVIEETDTNVKMTLDFKA